MGCCKMPKHGEEFDPDREGVSCEDMERFGGDEMRCPGCGADVYHDAAMCHGCGRALMDRECADAKRGAQRAVFAAAAIAAAAGLLLPMIF